MSAPLYEKIKKYAENPNVCRFHMPGHKGKADLGFDPIMKYDVTEVDATDNLYFPQESLLEAEKLAACAFGVKQTIFCAGGATLCNQTALSFFAGKKVLFERNIHISAFNAAMLLDIVPVFVYNNFDRQTGVVLPVESEQIENMLTNDTDIAAVFLTSTNYYGLCADCKKIKAVCKAHGVTLIADNSHGAHLKFVEDNDVSHCADIIIDSAHKTLPVLTGGAFLHFNIDVKRSDVCSRMLAFGSTSPSFPILASLDFAREWCKENGVKFKETKQRTQKLKDELQKYGVTVVTSQIHDPLRLCIATNDAENTDKKLQRQGLISEMCSGNCIVFMFSPFNSEEEFDRLEKALKQIAPKPPTSRNIAFPKTEFVCAPKTAFWSEKKEVTIIDAIDCTAAEAVIPYPPGVPILFPGEKITKETAEYLKSHNTDKVKVI